MSEVTMEAPPMPTEEALEVFKGMIFGQQSFEQFSKEEREAISRAIDLLEKQIPMPVKVTTSTKRCGRCNRQLSNLGNLHPTRNYCQGCGQAIKWGDEDGTG